MCRLRAWGLLIVLVGATALLVEARRVQGEDKPTAKARADFADLGDVQAEVTVLQVLQAMHPTAAQLDLLEKSAAKTMQKAPPRKIVKVSDTYRKALLALREALIEGDDEKIDEASSDLDDVREDETPDFDDADITDAARKQAATVLRAFSARQVALYIGGLDDFPDPAERLREAIVESRKKKAKEWTTYRDDIAYQVGWLAAGLDSAAEEKVRDKATALLNKAARLSETEFPGEREGLDRAANEIVGTVGPIDVMRHFMERLLAETLSNHRLAAAIEARKKKAAQ